MPDNPNFIEEGQIPSNWQFVKNEPIVPGQAPTGAPAPPMPHDMPQFFSGSINPALQHDVSFVGTKVGTPRIPQYSLMPFGLQSNPFTNAATASTSSKTVVISGGGGGGGTDTDYYQFMMSVGSIVTPQRANLNFDTGFTVVDDPPNFATKVSLPIFYYQTVQDAGVSATQRPKLNFASGFTVADNPGNNSTDVSVVSSALPASVKINGTGVSVDKQFWINAVLDGSAPTWTVQINGTSDGG